MKDKQIEISWISGGRFCILKLPSDAPKAIKKQINSLL
jgi:hypothetical protein